MNDEKLIKEALVEAEKAYSAGEVPVGAVVAHKGQIIARAHNLKETTPCATHHAEILAVERASETLGRWRLTDCTLYVTLEPCLMCAGALISSRIDTLVFGAPDPKAGAVQSVFRVFDEKKLNHHPTWRGGVLQHECGEILKRFFQARRA